MLHSRNGDNILKDGEKYDVTIVVQGSSFTNDKVPSSRRLLVVGDDPLAAHRMTMEREWSMSSFLHTPMTQAPFVPGKIPLSTSEKLVDRTVRKLLRWERDMRLKGETTKIESQEEEDHLRVGKKK